MSDDDDESAEPTVDLGEGASVEGAPLARVSSRLTWGIEKSTIVDRFGETVVRTPEGPTELSDLLAEVDVPYFERRQEFQGAVRNVMGDGPIPTTEE